MKYKKITIGKYMVEQLENYIVQVCNMCTGQICAWWEDMDREYTYQELIYFYEYYLMNRRVS